MAVLRRSIFISASAAAIGFANLTSPAAAQDNYIGQMLKLGGTFCPVGTIPADGHLLAVSEYPALFSLLGSTYGGDGRTSFALPNLAGRTMNYYGAGPGSSSYGIGERAGAETTALTVDNLAKHDRRGGIPTANAVANSATANGNVLGASSNNSFPSGTDPAGNLMDRTMVQVGSTGGSVPITNRPLDLVLTHSIALEGVFPARN